MKNWRWHRILDVPQEEGEKYLPHEETPTLVSHKVIAIVVAILFLFQIAMLWFSVSAWFGKGCPGPKHGMLLTSEELSRV
jgi:hypothetical protein